MKALQQLIQHFECIEEKIHYSFKDRALLGLAFVHRSYVNENRSVSRHNERLEFLGDSVLELLISEYLYSALPETAEGELSSLRAKLVEASACVAYVQKLDLEKYLLLGRGERMNSGRGRDSILADLFESIIGAVYLDGGLEGAKHFLFSNFSTEIDAAIQMPMKNSKAQLQDICQKQFQEAPTYKVLDEGGPDHNKFFHVAVFIERQELGRGELRKKKLSKLQP